MTYKPIENLKGHVKSRPPLVIFISCMFLFALSVIILGYYFKGSNIPNYDLSEDWNSFLSDLSTVDFCLTPNTSTVHSAIVTARPQTMDNTTVSATTDPFPVGDYDEDWYMKKNFTVSVMLMIKPSLNFVRAVSGVTLLASYVPASMLGVKGSNEMVSVQFEMPQTLKQQTLDNAASRGMSVHTCLTLMGSSSVFPSTKQPASCNTTDTHHENSTAWMAVKHNQHSQEGWCKHGTVAHANHKFDPRLTVMLSSAEQSLINLHLMYTSYFMFVMVIMWVCYALVKGPPTKLRNVHSIAAEKKLQPCA